MGQVCGGPALKMFFAEDLQLVLQGIICYDWAALRQHTRLEGFSADDQVVECVHNCSTAQIIGRHVPICM